MIMHLCTSEWFVWEDWHLEVFFYYKTKNAEVMIFQSYTPTYILEPEIRMVKAIRIFCCK